MWPARGYRVGSVPAKAPWSSAHQHLIEVAVDDRLDIFESVPAGIARIEGEWSQARRSWLGNTANCMAGIQPSAQTSLEYDGTNPDVP